MLVTEALKNVGDHEPDGQSSECFWASGVDARGGTLTQHITGCESGMPTPPLQPGELYVADLGLSTYFVVPRPGNYVVTVHPEVAPGPSDARFRLRVL